MSVQELRALVTTQLQAVSTGSDLFERIMHALSSYADRPAHCLADIRARNTKSTYGTLFEHLCALYLVHVRGYTHAWLLRDVPSYILAAHAMTRADMGIDIIAVAPDGSHIAVQCKFRRDAFRRVAWRDLSTFYALCQTTGPWNHCIVMTTAPGIRRVGKKPAHHTSICRASFARLSHMQWVQMCASDEQSAHEHTQSIVRAQRARFLDNLISSSN